MLSTGISKVESWMKLMSAVYLFVGRISILFSAEIGHVIIDIALAVIPSKNTGTQNPAFKSSYRKSHQK